MTKTINERITLKIDFIIMPTLVITFFVTITDFSNLDALQFSPLLEPDGSLLNPNFRYF